MSKRTSFDWVVKCLVMIIHPLILKLKNCSCWETKTKIWMYNLSSFSLYPLFILNNLFCLFIFLWFFTFFIFLSILMVIISLELTRVNPDRNIFSINVELTSTFLLYRSHYWSDNGFKGTHVIRACHSIHGGSIKITPRIKSVRD